MPRLRLRHARLGHAFHAKGLELGGIDDGAPGDRKSPGAYFAYFRDLDGQQALSATAGGDSPGRNITNEQRPIPFKLACEIGTTTTLGGKSAPLGAIISRHLRPDGHIESILRIFRPHSVSEEGAYAVCHLNVVVPGKRMIGNVPAASSWRTYRGLRPRQTRCGSLEALAAEKNASRRLVSTRRDNQCAASRKGARWQTSVTKNARS